MIHSFRCKDTERVFSGLPVARFANFRRVAERKLQLLDDAITLDFLRAPPGNRLEALAGNRSGQYSIRINAQFRICFTWRDQTPVGPEHVEIVDYH